MTIYFYTTIDDFNTVTNIDRNVNVNIVCITEHWMGAGESNFLQIINFENAAFLR